MYCALQGNSCRCLPDIIFLVKTEELSNFGSALRTKSLWLNDISQARNFAFALLDDREGEDGEILSDDAATDRLALAFTSSSWSVARVAIGKEESDTGWEHLDRSQSQSWDDYKRSHLCAKRTTPCFIGKPCLSLPPVMRTICGIKLASHHLPKSVHDSHT